MSSRPASRTAAPSSGVTTSCGAFAPSREEKLAGSSSGPDDLQAHVAVAGDGARDVPLHPRAGLGARHPRHREQARAAGSPAWPRPRRTPARCGPAGSRHVGSVTYRRSTARLGLPRQAGDAKAQQRAVQAAGDEGRAAAGGKCVAQRRAGRVGGDRRDGMGRGGRREQAEHDRDTEEAATDSVPAGHCSMSHAGRTIPHSRSPRGIYRVWALPCTTHARHRSPHEHRHDPRLDPAPARRRPARAPRRRAPRRRGGADRAPARRGQAHRARADRRGCSTPARSPRSASTPACTTPCAGWRGARRRPTASSPATASSTGATSRSAPTTSRSWRARWGRPASTRSSRLRALALTKRMPFVWLLDSAGARIQEAVGSLFAGTGDLFREEVLASGVIPQVAALMGPCAAGTAYIPGLADFVPMVKGRGSMALAGPHLVRAAVGEDVTQEQLGGSRVHCRTSGVGDLEVADDEACIAQIKRYLSFFPSHCEQDAAGARVRRPGRPHGRGAARRAAVLEPAALRHVRRHPPHRRRRRLDGPQAAVRALDHHVPGADGRPAGRDRRQPAAPPRRHPRQRRRRQGRALRLALRRVRDPARVPRRRAGLHGRHEGRGGGDHPPRREDAARGRRGDGAEGHRRHPQGLRRRLLRHERARLRARPASSPGRRPRSA